MSETEKSAKVFEAEGEKYPYLDETAIKTSALKAFEVKKGLKIQTEYTELTPLCPGSGMPDSAKILITYHADGGLAVELKSLKYYFLSYRTVGIFQEHMTTRVADDLRKLLRTKRLTVSTAYKSRGGLVTACTIGSLSEYLVDDFVDKK